MIFMADGYTRSSGKTGVILVSPGPGLGNIVTGCMEAYSDDMPLLIIHVSTGLKEGGKGALHEIYEPENIFRHLTKKIFIVKTPGETIGILEEAYQLTLSDTKGPVLVSIPYTFFEKNVDVETKKTVSRNIHLKTGRDEEAIRLLKDSLGHALRGKRRPVIVAGKSLMFEEAGRIIGSICRSASIPFLTTTGGKGIVNENESFSFGSIMQKGVVREIINDSDLVIAIGTRLRDVDAKRRGVKFNELFHIHNDDRWIGRNYRTSHRFAGDLATALSCLFEEFKEKRYDWNLDGLQSKRAYELSLLSKTSIGFSIMEHLRRHIPEETTVVCDLNYPSYWAEYYFPVTHQKTFIMPRGISPIFYSLPASIGAKIGRPDRPCLALCGDGGLLPTIAELSTIRKYSIPIVIFLYNNDSYGILENVMNDRYSVEGSMGLYNPDYVALARSFDIKAKRTATLEGLKKILTRDVSWDEPFLIEFIKPVSQPPWGL